MQKVDFKKYFFWLFIIDIFFTLGDFIFHETIELLEVYSYPIPTSLLWISTSPLFWYSVGKFVATLIIGSLIFFWVRKGKNTLSRTLILSVPVVLLMEGRYLISGMYGAEWHVWNTVMHFCVLTFVTYVIFYNSNLFGQKRSEK